MRVIASTVVRESEVGMQLTGSIYELDWDTGKVETTLPIPDPHNPATDDNPRGGVRGARGIAATPEGTVVANYDTLYLYDEDWNATRAIEHPLFLGAHEICFDGTHVYVSATAIDAVVKTTLDGEVEIVWDPHEDPLASEAGLSPRERALDPSQTALPALVDECHLNGIALHEGALIANLGKVRPAPSPRLVLLGQKALARAGLLKREKVNPYRCLIVSIDGNSVDRLLELTTKQGLPLHNGQRLADGRLIVNDSNQDEVRVFSADGEEELTRFRVPGSWLRGLYPLEGNEILVGSAPATVSLVDLAAGRIVRSVRLSSNPNEAVHGLIVADR